MAVAPKITAGLLRERRQLDEAQKNFQREAYAIAKQKEAIDADLKTELERAGKKTVARGGLRVTLIDGRPSVSWKKEFIKVANHQKAIEIESSAPRSTRIEVTEETVKSK